MEPKAKAKNADPIAKFVSLLQDALQFLVNLMIIAAALAFIWKNLPAKVSTLRD